MKQKIIILLGPPGSGKGSQAILLKESEKLPHVSTGDLLRGHMAEESNLGKKAKPYLESGTLVPDDLIIAMLLERIAKDDCKEGLILDGFPRTLVQSKKLKEAISDKAIIIVFNFELPDSKVIERITGRLICKGCSAPYHRLFAPPKKEGVCDLCGGKLQRRKDDTEQVIRTRLEVYKDLTLPLVKFYEDSGSLISIDASQNKKKIFESLEEQLNKM